MMGEANMKRNKIITAGEAVRVILNNDTVAISGFGGTGVPEELAIALETRFLETGTPRDLTLIYAAGMAMAKPGGSITLPTRAWSNASLADTGVRPPPWRHWP